MSVENCLKKVEDLLKSLKLQLDGDQKEIFELEQKATSIMNDLFKKDLCDVVPKTDNDMKTSFAHHSVLHTLFKDGPEETFFFKHDYDTKRKILAAERKAEYNAFLLQKEMERSKHRKLQEETNTVAPKSILESVDYEKLLAKRRDEESKFRDINHADHKIKEAPPEIKEDFKENVSFSSEKIVSMPPRSISTAEEAGSKKSKETHNRAYRSSSIFGDCSPKKKDSAYRDELLQQMEDRRRLAADERRRQLEAEEREARLLEEQRARMRMEYEAEAERGRRKREEVQRDRLRRLQEFQAREALIRDQKRPPTPQPPPPAEEQVPRPPSPPVPAVRSCVLLEKRVPPVQALRDVSEDNIFSSLAEIRRRIMQDQQKLKRDASDSSYEVTNRRIVGDIGDDD